MNLNQLLIDSIGDATSQVFTTMLDLPVEAGEPYREKVSPEPTDGVVSFIGLAGTWAGTGSLICPATLACRICAQMLMTEVTAVNEDVLDAVSEITNMIIGNVKTAVEERLGPLGLSIPTVIYGRNFQTRSARNAEWNVVPFNCQGEALLVKMFLTPGEPAPAHAGTAMAQPCPVDV